MARTLPAEKIAEVRPWLSQCRLRDAKDDPRLPDDLFARFPGSQQLPLRLALQLHESYDEDAVSLLKQVGLPSRPPLERMKSWVRSGLKESECRDLLRYLSDAGRWRRDYYELGPLLTAKWFSADGEQLRPRKHSGRASCASRNSIQIPRFGHGSASTQDRFRSTSKLARWDRPVSDPKKALEIFGPGGPRTARPL